VAELQLQRGGREPAWRAPAWAGAGGRGELRIGRGGRPRRAYSLARGRARPGSSGAAATGCGELRLGQGRARRGELRLRQGAGAASFCSGKGTEQGDGAAGREGRRRCRRRSWRGGICYHCAAVDLSTSAAVDLRARASPSSAELRAWAAAAHAGWPPPLAPLRWHPARGHDAAAGGHDVAARSHDGLGLLRLARSTCRSHKNYRRSRKIKKRKVMLSDKWVPL
jgi:hypothetical protein